MKKIKFIKSLLKLLNVNGKILIGDVSFMTRKELEECETHTEIWDDEEFYFVANEMMIV